MSDINDLMFSAGQKQENGAVEERVVSQARAKLRQHAHFCCRSDSIGIDYEKGRLVLIGRLPSFYLKQVLQTALRGLPDVQQIDNRVDVASPTGISSVRNLVSRKQPA